MYYLRSRFYVPKWRSFLTPDSLEYLDIYDLNGINLYTYCNNNPVMYVDPEGCSWDSFWNGVGNWFKDNWEYVVGGLVSSLEIGGGIALVFSGVGVSAGLGLFGVGIGSLLSGKINQDKGGTFIGGFAGNYFGSKLTYSMDGKEYDKTTLIMSSFINGGLNLCASILSGLTGGISSTLNFASTTNTRIAIRIIAGLLSTGGEAVNDIVSLLIGDLL